MPVAAGYLSLRAFDTASGTVILSFLSSSSHALKAIAAMNIIANI
jgi:hypothetical protein